jgi:hypothetical protein
MSEDRKHASVNLDPGIRIERMNTEKTRKEVGSETVYHAYFELSGYPAPEWRNIFVQEWMRLNLSQGASIDGAFLVVHCQLGEVAATLLPALQRTVATTNEAYMRYAQKETTALEHREDAWKKERKDVEAVAASLHFD